MRSSYKIIKGSSIDESGVQNVVTIFKKHTVKKSENHESSPVNDYDNLIKTMMKGAAVDREKILSDAKIQAREIKEKAYAAASKKGYEDGEKKGHDEGFKNAYDEGYVKNIEKAQAEGKAIRDRADAVLRAAVEEKNRYLMEKEAEIKKFMINTVETILKREIKDKDSLNNMVFDALSQAKDSRTFIVKSREKYCSEFREQIGRWKEQLPFKGDIFVIPDESIEEGSVIIERDSGKVVLSVDIAMKKLKDIFSDVK
ncbi:FliH/SctL family protein [Clostridium luticellarii]|jgi:flagellar assembly protein FliH|uniref:FliH/SctL family protein n=1 Tax=Clostridium luticellarii TaxID=1691940 RepID=UPI002355547B|nr:flagellar assembly protein FliH [Clostridium luticellarii]MCI1943673.1 flagellar assembly protein FliH [Clostridium luticellarii]MCI1968924.1 flagellar assembly protein FliH [Clostridium luticellarii]MCI1994301.1 flagellar assembly protein FliH [Clostridium luticellarii]MCI2038746.1 flagellar assembly protein FliH [Clostridium luticellarii]